MNQHPKTIKCPFDSSHVMPYDRFLNHLEKCKFPQKRDYAKCRYNPYHVIHKDFIDHHEKTCVDSKKYEVESDDDSWGVDDQPEKPEKSTVSTSVTATTSNCPRAKTYQKHPISAPKPKYVTNDAEDFDAIDFSGKMK